MQIWSCETLSYLVGTGIYFILQSYRGKICGCFGWESKRMKTHADISQNSAHEKKFFPNTNAFDIWLFNVHLIILFIKFF